MYPTKCDRSSGASGDRRPDHLRSSSTAYRSRAGDYLRRQDVRHLPAVRRVQRTGRVRGRARDADLDLLGFGEEELQRLLAPPDGEGDGLANEEVIPEAGEPRVAAGRSVAPGQHRCFAAITRRPRTSPGSRTTRRRFCLKAIYHILSRTTAPTIRRSRAGPTRTRTGPKATPSPGRREPGTRTLRGLHHGD